MNTEASVIYPFPTDRKIHLPFDFTLLAENCFKVHLKNIQDSTPADSTPNDSYVQMHLGVLIQTLKFSLRLKGQDLTVEDLTPTEKLISLHPFEEKSSKVFPDFSAEAIDKNFIYQGPYSHRANQAWMMYNKIFESISISPYSKLIIDPTTQKEMAEHFVESGYATLRKSVDDSSLWSQWKQKVLGRAWKFKESRRITTAMALWVVHTLPETSPYDRGRILITEWYRMTQRGLFGAPLYPLFADIPTHQDLKKMFYLEPESEIINIFHTGPLPRKKSKTGPL